MYTSGEGQFARPEAIVSHFHLREGDRVADLGAGSGHYMKPLSDAVGASGVVYMCEVQKQLVDELGKKAREQRLGNVRPLWGDIEKVGGTKIQEGGLDAVMIANVLFQVPDKQGVLAEASRILRTGGKFFVIDWADSFGGMGPHAEEVVYEEVARELAEALGFVYERSFPAGEHHYGLAFRKQ